MNYKALMHPNYAHTYGVVNYATGEIVTVASDIPRYALRAMLRRFYHELREARAGGDECRVALFNCRTEQILMEDCNEIGGVIPLFFFCWLNLDVKRLNRLLNYFFKNY